MRMYLLLTMLWFSMAMPVFSQQYRLQGIVTDEQQQPLPGCHIQLPDTLIVSDDQGRFEVQSRSHENIRLLLSFIGYQPMDTVLTQANLSQMIHLSLTPLAANIATIKVEGKRKQTQSLTSEVIQETFISRTQSGSFIHSLNRLPGVNSMDIGSHTSKPVIRGLSFSRVSVSENHIKQEGQHWGADHGLEIDPFAVESAEVVKGPSAIEYGSDAIGGYIHLNNNRVPAPNQQQGNFQLLGKSVNQLYGGSLYLESRKQHSYIKLRGTLLDFGDYRIPTDTILYLSRKIPIVNRALKNTAGYEQDFSVHTGVIYNQFSSSLSGSIVSQQAGFFPGAHGIPDLNRVQDDGDSRNTDYPFQKSTHTKLINNTRFQVGSTDWFLDLAYQHNDRSEWSQFHTHYPEQEAPQNDPDLELDFQLKTFQANLKTDFQLSPTQDLSIGVQSQWKQNDIAGYNFLLPNYQSNSQGAFIRYNWKLSPTVSLFSGVRFDLSQVEIAGYFDPVLFDYLKGTGATDQEAESYATRSKQLKRSFQDFSWLVGLVIQSSSNITTRINLGKAFRTPTPIELASNGVHHGSFRHEQGDNQLKPERGYYGDLSLEWRIPKGHYEITPYLYYFSNYIFLNPTGEWSKLPHAGQIYRYTDSRALLSGVEISLNQQLLPRLQLSANLEYIRNTQLSEQANQRYPLPFTPPTNAFGELEYQFHKPSKYMEDLKFFINTRIALDQNRVARNELKTPGYQLFGLGLSSQISTSNQPIAITLQVMNLLNTKHFNAISFYRRLEIPEPGRNIQLHVKIPFIL